VNLKGLSHNCELQKRGDVNLNGLYHNCECIFMRSIELFSILAEHVDV
jgi:hypothetical protein